MEFRNFRDGDYESLCAFLAALGSGDGRHANWNWARLEWMWGHPETDISLAPSIGLWTEGGAVTAAAIYDMYFGEAFCGTLPGYGHLYPEVLDYAVRELSDENGLGVSVREDCEEEMLALKRAGFAPAEQHETLMALDLTSPLPSAPVPCGLRLTEADYAPENAEALQWMFWQGFGHGDDREEFERDGRAPSRPRPHFDRKLSIALVDADGQYASHCCVWYLPGTDYAYVEPVCTVPGWRGKGAAKAAVYEAAGRAVALGAERAFVISDLPFYEKLGFRRSSVFRFWWKK